MVVYKFGGASIATSENILNLVPILQEAGGDLVIVVSAIGKTTNALEAIVATTMEGNEEEAQHLLFELELFHIKYATQILTGEYYTALYNQLKHQFSLLEQQLLNIPSKPYDFAYDQVVCFGEIFSSLIFSFFMQEQGIKNEWMDIRKMLLTDANYRDGNVQWAVSAYNVQTGMSQYLKAGMPLVTQGYIAATENGNSVTLGREGSDYTAALLAVMLGADAVTIWKDVPGLLNADPKIYEKTEKIENIGYNEVLEMAYYGAQIIHPKTIKPLQNANIPLYVKCFKDRHLRGTVISEVAATQPLPPLIVFKYHQTLLQVTTRDYSFITEDSLSKVYGIFHNLKIKVNMMQNSALSFVACIDYKEAKLLELSALLTEDYKVLTNNDVTLLTIRYPTPQIISELTDGKTILLMQETRKTVQVVMV